MNGMSHAMSPEPESQCELKTCYTDLHMNAKQIEIPLVRHSKRKCILIFVIKLICSFDWCVNEVFRTRMCTIETHQSLLQMVVLQFDRPKSWKRTAIDGT